MTREKKKVENEEECIRMGGTRWEKGEVGVAVQARYAGLTIDIWTVRL